MLQMQRCQGTSAYSGCSNLAMGKMEIQMSYLNRTPALSITITTEAQAKPDSVRSRAVTILRRLKIAVQCIHPMQGMQAIQHMLIMTITNAPAQQTPPHQADGILLPNSTVNNRPKMQALAVTIPAQARAVTIRVQALVVTVQAQAVVQPMACFLDRVRSQMLDTT